MKITYSSIVFSVLWCFVFANSNVAEALTIKKAQMTGNSLFLEVRDSVQGPLRVDGFIVGNINNKGEFKDTISPFSSETCVITVSDGSDSSGTTPSGCSPTGTPPPPPQPPTLTSISVVPLNAFIEAGQTQAFTATGTFSDATTSNVTATAIWASSNSAVATVNASGETTGVLEGAATITASQGGITSNSVAVTVTATPLPPPPPPGTFTMEVFTNVGTGAGTVTSNPPGIDCGPDCIELFNEGTVVTLTAVADPGSVFEGWNGGSFDCQQGFGNSTTTVTMDGDKFCFAEFNPEGPPDPVGEPQKLFDGGATIGDRFGDAVAVDGAWAMVGATEIRSGSSTQPGPQPAAPPPGPGKVFFYQHNGTTWTQVQSFSGEADFNRFGISANLSGNLAIVGSRLGDGTFENSGAAFIYRLSGGSWSQEAKLIREDAGVTDAATHPFFGESVAIDGDLAIIGSPHKDLATNVDRAGEAYIYRRNAGGAWVEDIRLSTIASGHDAGDNFGSSVAIQGNTAVVGAQFDENAIGEQRGAVYIFETDGTGNWIEVVRLLPSTVPASFFGETVSFSGNAIAVGAVGDTVPENPDCSFNCGAVYVFRKDGGTGQWSEEQKIFRNDPLATNFGISLDIDGNFLVVGARFQTTTTSRTGAGYLFRFDGTQWGEVAEYAPGDARQDDEIGREVAVSGNAAFIGVPFQDPFFPGSTPFPFEENQGAVYVFPASGIQPTLQVELAGNSTGTVTSSPAGINCGADCQEIYAFDAQVVLTAVPVPGTTFLGFSGHPDCEDGTLTMGASRRCLATFDISGNLQPLTIEKVENQPGNTGTGTVTDNLGQINCGSTCTANYTLGQVVNLTATPDPGARFAGWTGVCSGTSNCTVTMDQARLARATFDQEIVIVPGPNLILDGDPFIEVSPGESFSLTATIMNPVNGSDPVTGLTLEMTLEGVGLSLLNGNPNIVVPNLSAGASHVQSYVIQANTEGFPSVRFILFQNGAIHRVARREVVVSASPPPGPPTVDSFSVSPTVITEGQSATLSWATTDATSVSINGGASQPADGSTTVSPATTTTYTLTATGAGGTDTATVTVTVSEGIASLTLNPTTITGGSGASSTGTVTLPAPAPPGGVVVTLSSSNVALAASVPSITVPAGATQGTFTITTNSRYRKYSGLAFTVTIAATTIVSTQSATLTVTAGLPPADITSGAAAGAQTQWEGLMCGGIAPIGGNREILYNCSLPSPVAGQFGSCTFQEECSIGCRRVPPSANGGVFSFNDFCATTGPNPVSVSRNYIISGDRVPASLVTEAPVAARSTQGFPATISEQGGPGAINGLNVNASVFPHEGGITFPTGGSSVDFEVATSYVPETTFQDVSGFWFDQSIPPLLITNGRSGHAWMTMAPPDPPPALPIPTLGDFKITGLNPVTGGQNSIGQIDVSGTSSGGGPTITLTSSHPGIASVPATFVMPASTVLGQQVPITTQAPSVDTNVTITATDGRYTFSDILLVKAAAPPPVLSGVSVNPTSVVGGNSATGTVTLSAPQTGATVVTLSTPAPPSVATLPASVTVPAGVTSVTFLISTAINNSNLNFNMNIFADLAGSPGQSALLIITPTTPTAISAFALNPIAVAGGTASTGTVTLNAVAPAGGSIVNLASDNNAVATVPASVTVSAGATSATFTVTTNSVTVATMPTISATFNGGTWNSVLTVNPPEAPAVILNSFSAIPTSITAGGSATLNWTTTNATSVSINGGINLPANGSISVNPATTTTYNLTAMGAGGTATATVTVTVNSGGGGSPQGTVSISGPSSINRGDRTSFTVTLTNTGSSTITGANLSFTVNPASLLKDVSPGATVAVGNVAPGSSVSQTWNVRGDNEGSGTVTAGASSGGTSLDSVAQGLTVVK